MIHRVISVLKADSGITQLVPADNIVPLVRLQGQQLPAIVLQLVGTDPVQTKDPHPSVDDYNLEITVLDESPAQAWNAARKVRLLLEEIEENIIRQARLIDMATDVFEGTEVFSVTQRYTVTMNWSKPVLITLPTPLPVCDPVTVTDSDGTVVSVASGESFSCQPIVPKNGIFYQRQTPWQGNDPQVDGSVFWHSQNGTYDYSAPLNPEYIAALKNGYQGTDADSLLLQQNAFGNQYRFTNDIGQQYVEDFHKSAENSSQNPKYCIDHYTGLGYYVQKGGGQVGVADSERFYRSFRQGIEYANSFEYAGFSDWRLADVGEYLQAVQYNDWRNSFGGVYAPFVDTQLRQYGAVLLLGSYTKDNKYVRVVTNSLTIQERTDIDAVENGHLILLRNHYI